MKEEPVSAISESFSFIYDLILPIAAFVIPLVLPAPKFAMEIFINFCLFLSATRSSSRLRFAVIVYPAIALFLNSIIYGADSNDRLFFIPFAVFGNYILVRSYRNLRLKIKLHRVFFSSLLKSFFIFFVTILFFLLGMIPVDYLTEMGIYQFLAAVIGGSLSLITLPYTQNSEA